MALRRQPTSSSSMSKEMTALVQNTAASFLAADLNCDHKLNLNEFKLLIPEQLRKDSESVAEIFRTADVDGDGEISRHEFFFWTLSWVQDFGGHSTSGVQDIFRSYDSSGDGKLNLKEFCSVVENLGFGDVGHALFKELDPDGSGTVSLVELQTRLRGRRGNYSRDCKQLLTAMSFQKLEQEGPKKMIFSESWSAATAEEVRETLRKRTAQQLGRPFDCWTALLAGTGTKRRMTRTQFETAMRKATAYNGPADLLDEAYAMMDDDSSNTISIDEFTN